MSAAAPSLAGRLPIPTDPPPAAGVLRHLGIEECVRLPLRVDAARVAAELDGLPAGVWGAASRDPVVQASVESFFAVGYPRGPRPLPAEDRPVLERLPYLRSMIREAIPATPTRAIVARLCAHGLIPIHTDTPRFFRGTVRLTIQVAAQGSQRLFCNGLWYDVGPGEVWAIDNLVPHGVHNAGARSRVNVLVDYGPSDALAALIAAGERGLGTPDAAATRTIELLSRERYRRMRWRGVRYEIFKRIWRRRA